MNIISLGFLCFVLGVIALYFIAPKKYQWLVLLAGNIIFYASSNLTALLYVFITALASFVAALGLESLAASGKAALVQAETNEDKKHIKSQTLRKKKQTLTLTLALILGIWIVLKYGNFLLENVNILLSALSIGSQFDMLKIAVPLGISYYTFHAVGYMVDVYRGKYQAERDFLRYFTFISFFPHIVQGPFSRYDQLGKSLFEEHVFSYDRLCEGSRRVLWGFFKKLVVADKLGIAVVSIFSEPTGFSGLYYIFGMMIYGVQIYADFSGYMDIMCGVCRTMDISLAENFNQPYFAKSVDEFWRRWHITLGKWFKDYVFYPVSMGKTAQKMGKWARKKFGARTGKLFPGYFALIFVWTATGLWHGANWTFLVWGYLNMAIILFSMHMEENYNKVKAILHINSDSVWWQLFCIVRTFMIVCFLRYFSIAENVGTAILTLHHAFTSIDFAVLSDPTSLLVGLTYIEVMGAFIGFVIILLVDILREKSLWDKAKVNCPFFIRNLIYAALIFSIILFAGGDNDLIGGFMYANF